MNIHKKLIGASTALAIAGSAVVFAPAAHASDAPPSLSETSRELQFDLSAPSGQVVIPEAAYTQARNIVQGSPQDAETQRNALNILDQIAGRASPPKASNTLAGLSPAQLKSFAQEQANRLLDRPVRPVADLDSAREPGSVLAPLGNEFLNQSELLEDLRNGRANYAELASAIRDAAGPDYRATIGKISQKIGSAVSGQVAAAIRLASSIQQGDTAQIAVNAAELVIQIASSVSSALFAAPLLGIGVAIASSILLRILGVVGQIIANNRFDSRAYEEALQSLNDGWFPYTTEFAKTMAEQVWTSYRANWEEVKAATRYEYYFFATLIDQTADSSVATGEKERVAADYQSVFERAYTESLVGLERTFDEAVKGQNKTIYSGYYSSFRGEAKKSLTNAYFEYRCSQGPAWMRITCKRNGTDRTDTNNAEDVLRRLDTVKLPVGPYNRSSFGIDPLTGFRPELFL